MPDFTRGTPPPILYIPRPSTWLFWHDFIDPGMTVLDLACGEGRHALLAAQWGATVTAVDRDDAKLDTGREAASRLGVTVEFQSVDLEGEWPEFGTFDVVLMFNFLDRQRMPSASRGRARRTADHGDLSRVAAGPRLGAEAG